MSWRNIIALDGNSTAGAKVTFGNVAGIAGLLAIVVGAFMLLHELLLFVAVGAREVNKDIISNTESLIHKNTHTVDALSVDFVVTGMSGCLSRSFDPLLSIDMYKKVIGFWGFRELTQIEKDDLSVNGISKCAAKFVLSASSVSDARERNQILMSMGYAPYTDQAIAALRIGR